MDKISFTYKKDDGSVSKRILVQPKFLKESHNYINDFTKENVKYVQGYEVDKAGLNELEAKKYEEIINDYFELAIPTLNDFISEQGLDPKRVMTKTFKKDGISDLNVL